MNVLIDRFEGDFAVLETPDKKFFNVPKDLLSDFSEGDVLLIEKDLNETEKRQKNVKDTFSALFKK